MFPKSNRIIAYFFITFLSGTIVLGLWGQPWRLSDENSFGKALIHHDVSTHIWKKIKYDMFREGLDGVVIGENNMLFTSEEFSYEIKHAENIQKKLKYIREVARRLSEDNIQLIVLPIPSKVRLYDPSLLPEYREKAYAQVIHLDLPDNHYVFDSYQFLKQNFHDDAFFTTDTHWTPDTTKGIARKLSDLISLKTNKKTFITEERTVHSFEGDLISYVFKKYFEDEQYKSYKTYMPEASLFDTQEFPIVLIGTSYSADSRWHFEGFLKQYFQRDVLNVSQKAKGPFIAMQNYLQTEYQELGKPEAVIWEIPERYLPVSYDLEAL